MSELETNEIKIIPFEQFTKPIKDAAESVKKVTEFYLKAQHNKKIAKILMERIAAANLAISLLQDNDLYTTTHYTNLQRLVQVLQKMKKYTEEITQYSTLLKFLKTKSIESQFNELCQEYDDSVDPSLTVNFKANAERDSKILKEETENLLKFQKALLENTNTSDMNKIIDQVSEISITMQNLENEEGEKKAIQKKIDSIFVESPLPFKEYVATDITRGEDENGKVEITKYVKGQTAFAFKAVEKENIGQVKNQVAILKKIDYQNVIRFYGYAKEGNDKYYLIIDWAEEGSLYKYIKENGQDIKIEQRLKFAYDIAKGLNFLNSVKVHHQDIKSENIVIVDQNAKITNFKLSKGYEGATGNLAVTIESVRHSSPEALRRGISGTDKDKKKKRYDIKSEVYSFGILLWEIAECRTPYLKFEDFMEVTNSVINGYREPLTPDTGIPEKYQSLVNEAVDQNPGNRPLFAKILVDLQDVFKNYTPSGQTTSRSDSNRPPLPAFNTSIDEVVDNHHKAAKTKDKPELSKCYKLFDVYANMGNPKAKYWKAYYITKGWSDHPPSSKKENIKIATKLFKEAADYSDEFSEAQLRYALNVMSQNKEEAIEYLLKAAKNGHAVAMFNVATYYFSSGNRELGRYYMIMAANKKYQDAINYCKENNLS